MSTPDGGSDGVEELQEAEALRAELEAEMEAELATAFDAEGPVDADRDRDEPEVSIALSPSQLIGGFAVLAAIVIWLLRRRKR